MAHSVSIIGMQVPNRRPVIVQGQGYSEASTLASLKEVGKGVILAVGSRRDVALEIVLNIVAAHQSQEGAATARHYRFDRP